MIKEHIVQQRGRTKARLSNLGSKGIRKILTGSHTRRV